MTKFGRKSHQLLRIHPILFPPTHSEIPVDPSHLQQRPYRSRHLAGAHVFVVCENSPFLYGCSGRVGSQPENASPLNNQLMVVWGPVVWDSNQGTPKNPNPWNIRGSEESKLPTQNHQLTIIVETMNSNMIIFKSLHFGETQPLVPSANPRKMINVFHRSPT